MRVVHVCRAAPPSVGGMEAQIEGLARHQVMAGDQVRWVTVQPGDGGVAGVELVRLPRTGPERWPRGCGLPDAIGGADLVHVHGIDGLGDQVLASRRAPMRVGVSTHGGFLHSRRQWALKQLMLRTWVRWSLGRADAVWFTSEVDRRALAPAHLRGSVVPNGVELGPLRTSVRRPTPGLWVVPGRVDRHKGHADLLRLVAEFRRLDPSPIRVEVLGAMVDPGVERALLEARQALGLADVVTFRGQVGREAWMEALATCELAIFPSTWEGFGIAVVEAMACGVAPIARSIPAHRALIRDGVDGDLLEFDEGAAARLVALRRRPREVMGGRARQAAETWGWEQVFPRWQEAYAAVLEGR